MRFSEMGPGTRTIPDPRTGDYLQLYWRDERSMVNLDSGEITEWESLETKTTVPQARTTHPGVVDAEKLAKLRGAAARLWCSEPPSSDSIRMSPGVEMEDEVISGQRLVPFERYDAEYGYIVAAIESALPADAATVMRFTATQREVTTQAEVR